MDGWSDQSVLPSPYCLDRKQAKNLAVIFGQKLANYMDNKDSELL